MKHLVRVGWMVAACAGTALAAGPQAHDQLVEVDRSETAWKAQWRAERNRLIEQNPLIERDPTSVLVRFKDDADPALVALVRGVVAGRTIDRFEHVAPGLEHLAISGSVDEAMRAIELVGGGLGVIEYVEADTIGRVGATPNDSFFTLLWGLNNTGQTVNRDRGTSNADIDAPQGWDVRSSAGSFVVGMADSGIRRTHEDLAANIWTNPGETAGNGIDDDGNGYVDDTWGWDFYNNDNNPSDDNGHGSHTAGTVGAVGNNGKGVTGVAWTVQLAGLKIGSASGSIAQSAAIASVNYCVGKGIKLSNHSWGGGGYSQGMFDAINAARSAGHLIVAAAGNGGFDSRGDNNDSLPQYPASYALDNIVAVAALDNDNRLASFSNFGAASVDLGAPGVTIASCYNSADNAYVYNNGTSMATPHVTGAAALVWAQNPAWTYAQVRSKLLSSVKPVGSLSGKTVTGGSLNLNNALR